MPQEFLSLSELLHFTVANPHSNTKAFCRLGSFGQQETRLMGKLLNTNELDFELIIDSDGIRHSLAQHGIGKSAREILRGQIPIVEADFLAILDWLLTPTAIRSGQIKPGKQPQVELESSKPTGTMIVIMEWRPGRKQLALKTMYKKRPAA